MALIMMGLGVICPICICSRADKLKQNYYIKAAHLLTKIIFYEERHIVYGINSIFFIL